MRLSEKASRQALPCKLYGAVKSCGAKEWMRKMNYAAIKKTDVANGPGIRVSLFVSGCTHACKGCFNSEAWDFCYGREFGTETEEEILRALAPDYIRGFSVLGGEPMEPQNRDTVLEIMKKVRAAYPGKDIWCYTGYDYEKDLLRWEREEADAPEKKADKAAARGPRGRGTQAEKPGTMAQLLALIDVLVDGEFVEEKKNLRLAFRGSENQRLIDVKKSRTEGRVVCLPEQSIGMK